jgi:multimeric flavodoxin WrbA
MKALIVNGSPRGEKATSHILGTLLGEGLRGHGVEVRDAWALGALNDDARTAELLDAFDAADLVVLSFPLYVDSLPAPLTQVLELYAQRVAGRGGTRERAVPRLAAIVQCGFPEAAQCDTSLAICRNFARAAGMEWAGGMAMGGGGMLANGLDKIPPKSGQAVRSAIAEAVDALAWGEAVPESCVERLRAPIFYKRLYIMIANVGWHVQARQNKAARSPSFRAYPGRA